MLKRFRLTVGAEASVRILRFYLGVAPRQVVVLQIPLYVVQADEPLRSVDRFYAVSRYKRQVAITDPLCNLLFVRHRYVAPSRLRVRHFGTLAELGCQRPPRTVLCRLEFPAPLIKLSTRAPHRRIAANRAHKVPFGTGQCLTRRLSYATALELGHRAAAYNLGLYWEGHLDRSAPGDVVPDRAKAAQAYKRGGPNAKCVARLDALRAR
jgi:hypothetical protein